MLSLQFRHAAGDPFMFTMRPSPLSNTSMVHNRHAVSMKISRNSVQTGLAVWKIPRTDFELFLAAAIYDLQYKFDIHHLLSTVVRCVLYTPFQIKDVPLKKA